MQELIFQFAICRCQEVVAEFGAILPPTVNGRTPHRQQVVNFAFGLQTALAEANMRLQVGLPAKLTTFEY